MADYLKIGAWRAHREGLDGTLEGVSPEAARTLNWNLAGKSEVPE